MTARIRSELKRIILILIAAGMVAGLVYPATNTEAFDAVHGLGGYQNMMSTPDLPAMPDFIADSSAQVDFTRFLNEKGGSERQYLASTDSIWRADLKSRDILSLTLCTFLLCVLFGTSVFSFKHILYIHLKDGNK